VARRGVVHVARRELLLAVGVAEHQPPGDHRAPVRAGAAAVGQVAEVRGRVGVDGEPLERGGGVAERDVADTQTG
jgi:hypothetical protein